MFTISDSFNLLFPGGRVSILGKIDLFIVGKSKLAFFVPMESIPQVALPFLFLEN